MNASLPPTMTCIGIPEPGDCDALKPETRPLPEAGAGEVLIKVAAAGVNRPDIVQRLGNYPPPPGVTDIPGLEIAGEIVAVGAGADALAIGDQVTALVAGGGYAEYCVAPGPQVLPLPDGLSMVEAAAIPETFFTVWTNVFDRCGLKDGESLLVHGGSSGIGTAAIMIASNLGHPVIATAGNGDKCQACVDLGAGLAINYKDEDFVAAVMDFTGDKGVDVILDMVAGDYINRDIQCLAVEGRIGIIALLGGAKGEINFSNLFRKRGWITGSTLRARSVDFKGDIAQSLKTHVWPLLAAGKCKPIIHATRPLDQAADAHRVLEEGSHIGKVVLTVT